MSKPLLTLLMAGVLCSSYQFPVMAQFDDLGALTQPVPQIRKEPLSADYVAQYPVPPSERVVREKLRTRVSLEFIDSPLEDAIDFLYSKLELPILLDEICLQDSGIPTDQCVNLIVDDVSIESGLELVLDPFGFDWIQQDGIVKVIPDYLAEECMSSRSYDVTDLVLTKGDEGTLVADFGGLVDAIHAIPGAWPHHGGVVGSVATFETATVNALVIRQTQSRFQLIDDMLRRIREVRASQSVLVDASTPEWVRAVETRLAKRVDVDFDSTPLTDAFNYLGQLAEANIVFDRPELSKVGIPLDEPVNLRLHNVAVSTVFDLVLGNLGLEYQLQHEVIRITSSDRTTSSVWEMEMRVYDVRDLVTYELESGKTIVEERQLTEAIYEHTGGHYELRHGRGGTILFLGDTGSPVFVIWQDQRTHRNIQRLLHDLRALQAQ